MAPNVVCACVTICRTGQRPLGGDRGGHMRCPPPPLARITSSAIFACTVCLLFKFQSNLLIRSQPPPVAVPEE